VLLEYGFQQQVRKRLGDLWWWGWFQSVLKEEEKEAIEKSFREQHLA
jgi:predicted restriction endonuclease